MHASARVEMHNYPRTEQPAEFNLGKGGDYCSCTEMTNTEGTQINAKRGFSQNLLTYSGRQKCGASNNMLP